MGQKKRARPYEPPRAGGKNLGAKRECVVIPNEERILWKKVQGRFLMRKRGKIEAGRKR